MATQREKAERFKALHEREGAFVIPNPWDVGSARLLAGFGFEALGTGEFPAGMDHLVDEEGFGVGGGGVFGCYRFREFFELVGVLGGQDVEGAAGQAVADGIARGRGFAGGRFGAG